MVNVNVESLLNMVALLAGAAVRLSFSEFNPRQSYLCVSVALYNEPNLTCISPIRSHWPSSAIFERDIELYNYIHTHIQTHPTHTAAPPAQKRTNSSTKAYPPSSTAQPPSSRLAHRVRWRTRRSPSSLLLLPGMSGFLVIMHLEVGCGAGLPVPLGA